MAKDHVDGRALAEAKAAEVVALDWEQLDAYGEQVQHVRLPSGEVFRVKSYTFWDMKEWESDLYVHVKVYAPCGWRRLRPHNAWRTRGGETLPPRP